MVHRALNYHETFGNTLHFHVPVSKVLYRGTTALGRDVLIFETPNVGWVVTIDGELQNTSVDSTFYHEILAHVPLVAHGSVKSAMIVGGASGALAKQLLLHPIERIDMVDIDCDVVRICKQHLPSEGGGCFSDPRLHLIHQDAAIFLKATNQRYDLIVLDTPDLDEPGPVASLAVPDFFPMAKESLSQSGILVCQSSVPFFGMDSILRHVNKTFHGLFRYHGAFGSLSPFCPGGFQTFYWGSDNHDLGQYDPAAIAQRVKSLSLHGQFYNPKTHVAALAFGEALMRYLAIERTSLPNVQYDMNEVDQSRAHEQQSTA